MYTYGEGKGHLNNVVRYNEGLSVTFKTFDTSRKSGMLYELLTNSTTAYYKNVLAGDSILEVDDLHANVVAIFPVFIFYNKNIAHSFGVGISIGNLTSRDYYDQTNKLIPYNSTTFPEIKFGKLWTSGLILDYVTEMRFAKRWGCNLGIRLTTSTPVNSRSNFVITQGNSISLKYGLFYQFK